MGLLKKFLDSVSGVEDVTGNIVNNTDPTSPVVTQLQADWNQTNNASVDFIKNKPTVNGELFDTEYSLTANATLTQWKAYVKNVSGDNILTLDDITGNLGKVVIAENLSGSLTIKDADDNEITILNGAGQTCFLIAGESEVQVIARDIFPDGSTIIINANGQLEAVGDGSGDVVGPASSTDGNFALFDGTTGKLIKNSSTSPSSFYTKTESDNLLADKVDVEAGKGLSTNDFTNSYKSQLDNAPANINSSLAAKEDSISNLPVSKGGVGINDLSGNAGKALTVNTLANGYEFISYRKSMSSVEISSSNSPYSAQPRQRIVVDMSIGDVNINLPAGSSWLQEEIEVKRLGSSNILTLIPNGSETIDGAASYVIDGNATSRTAVSFNNKIYIF